MFRNHRYNSEYVLAKVAVPLHELRVTFRETNVGILSVRSLDGKSVPQIVPKNSCELRNNYLAIMSSLRRIAIFARSRRLISLDSDDVITYTQSRKRRPHQRSGKSSTCESTIAVSLSYSIHIEREKRVILSGANRMCPCTQSEDASRHFVQQLQRQVCRTCCLNHDDLQSGHGASTPGHISSWLPS